MYDNTEIGKRSYDMEKITKYSLLTGHKSHATLNQSKWQGRKWQATTNAAASHYQNQFGAYSVWARCVRHQKRESGSESARNAKRQVGYVYVCVCVWQADGTDCKLSLWQFTAKTGSVPPVVVLVLLAALSVQNTQYERQQQNKMRFGGA